MCQGNCESDGMEVSLMMGYYASNGRQGWMLMAMWIGPLAVTLAVWALVALTRDSRATSSQTSEEHPTDILKRRFARGELTQEDYLQAVATLEAGKSRTGHR